MHHKLGQRRLAVRTQLNLLAPLHRLEDIAAITDAELAFGTAIRRGDLFADFTGQKGAFVAHVKYPCLKSQPAGHPTSAAKP
jgi:hypothetical protein